MRIDLPLCGLDSCRYSFDGNCISKPRYQGCEFAYFKRLEAADRLILLPCERVYYIVDITNPKLAMIMSKRTSELRVYEIERIDEAGYYWSTKEKAEAKLKELKGE